MHDALVYIGSVVAEVLWYLFFISVVGAVIGFLCLCLFVAYHAFLDLPVGGKVVAATAPLWIGPLLYYMYWSVHD